MLGKYLITFIFALISYTGYYHENLIIQLIGFLAFLIMAYLTYLSVKEDYIKRYNEKQKETAEVKNE